VKSFVKKKNEFERPDKKKLPFWAPPSINKCRLHFETDCPIDCKFQSLNRIVMNMSKTTKDSKVLQDSKGREKVWELNTYFEDRLKVMTTYSDAKNCTFTPAILSRMPEKYKAFMESVPQYQSWVTTKLAKPKSFEVYYIYYIIKFELIMKFSNGSKQWERTLLEDSLGYINTGFSRDA